MPSKAGECVDLVGACHIRRGNQDFRARRLDFGRGLFERADLDVRDGDAHPFARCMQCERPPDPAAGPRDHGHAPFESVHDVYGGVPRYT